MALLIVVASQMTLHATKSRRMVFTTHTIWVDLDFMDHNEQTPPLQAMR
jgi:hypothetical protein